MSRLVSEVKWSGICAVFTILKRQVFVLKAAHPQRDGRSNEQITQQAERPTPPTTVRIGWTILYLPRVEVPCVVASENGNSQHFAQGVSHRYEPVSSIASLCYGFACLPG